MKVKEIAELNELYSKSEDCDREIFAEMKSNVLLANSEHYKKMDIPGGRGGDELMGKDRPKVRVTKNLTAKITSRIQDGIMGLCPDLKAFPANESELSDKKAAELYDSVLEFGKERYKLNEKKEDWCADFVTIGEVAVKISWDPQRGSLRAYEQKKNDQGQPMYVGPNNVQTPMPFTQQIDPLTGAITEIPHEPEADKEKPIFSGDFVFETIFPANLMRSPDAETMDESPYLIIRKTMDKEKAKNLIDPNDPKKEEKLTFLQQSSEKKYRIFDHNTHNFEDSDGQVLLREYYFRPCFEYPEGYFYLTTEFGKIAEGPLPFGEFPIKWRGYKRKQTSPRAHSVIKIIRPYQIELNRASSKEVEHQLTHGDDKVITSPGAKLTQEATSNGIRQIKALGATQIIPGRTGEQYRPYINSTIEEMFFAVSEEPMEDQGGTVEPVALLYRSIRRNQRYGRVAKEFQAFMKDVFLTYLRLAKHYYDDTWVIRAVGRKEQVNLPEFRKTEDLSVQIRLIDSNSDAETLLGKFLVLQQTLQYVGKDLPRESLGKVLTNMPFANGEEIFSSLTLDYKNVENDMLALDRGEPYQAEPDANHQLYINELTARIKSPDFRALDPSIQQNYMQAREGHRFQMAEQEKKIMMAKHEAIPTGGNLVKADMYVMKDGKQVRATIPDETLKWALRYLEQVGMTQERLETFSMADQAAVGQKMMEASQAALSQQQQNPINPNQGGLNGI